MSKLLLTVLPWRVGDQVWVITGDKQETAINIAISCKLIRHPDSLLICNADSPEEAAQRISDLTAQVCFCTVCACRSSSLLKITCCVSTAQS